MIREAQKAGATTLREIAAAPNAHGSPQHAVDTQLTFASSDTSAGIQAADVIAGFVMRYVQGINAHAKLPSPESAGAFQSLLEMAEPKRGTGFNFVISRGDFARLGLLRA